MYKLNLTLRVGNVDLCFPPFSLELQGRIMYSLELQGRIMYSLEFP